MRQIKWRVPIESYIIIETETPDGAKRELEAMKEALANQHRLPSDEERNLLLNAKIGTPNPIT